MSRRLKAAGFPPTKTRFNIVPTIIRDAAALQKILNGVQPALTPTMGCLHEGHLSLVRKAKKLSTINVVSIYVNPAQFAPHEDFSKYPRDLKADCRRLEGLADIVFAPKNLYPRPQTVHVALPPLAGELCGRFRPGFFEGVSLAVCKLFNCVRPCAAVFGKKDFQQLHIVQLLASQMNYPVRIVAAPIIRESDGLAMSSRNVYLTADERARAPLVRRTLRAAAAEVTGGQPPKTAVKNATVRLRKSGFTPDYVEARDYATLGAPQPGKKIVLLAAAVLGKARLIDNIECTAKEKRR